MRTYQRSTRKGVTIIEVMVAAFIVATVSLTGAAFYGSARIGEIQEWNEQNSLYIAEKEVEAWQANEYTGLAGFQSAQVDPNFLPYGYEFGSPDASWNVAGRYRDQTINGFTYRIKARLAWTHNTGSPANDYFVQQVSGGVTYRYRRLIVHVRWNNGTRELQTETRLAQ